MKTGNITYRVSELKRSQWLKPYIELNTLKKNIKKLKKEMKKMEKRCTN